MFEYPIEAYPFPEERKQPSDDENFKDGLSERRPLREPWESNRVSRTPNSTVVEPHNTQEG